MEILIRKYGNEYYVWKTCTCKDNRYFLDNEFETEIYNENILAVKDDTRIGHVQCTNCGKMIKDDPESIEQHFAEEEAKRDCLKCEYLRTDRNIHNKTTEFSNNGNGTYRVVEAYDAELTCGMWYHRPNIDSEDAKTYCMYYQCRRSGVAKIDDMFVRYPDPFVRQITVDVLNAKKYPYEGYHDGFFQYDIKLRGNVSACVNELGIVDHFRFNNRGYVYKLYYSDKYDKLFYAYGRKLKENCTDIMTDTKLKQVMDKIRALYKEVKEDE